MAAMCGTEKQLNLMLIGKTGEGKSATGNTILGTFKKNRLFHEASDMASVTQDVVDKFTRFDGFLLKVVDCPGLMDTEKKSGEDTEAAAKNLGIALGKCNGGVDAFIFVITRKRFTEEQRKTLEALKQIFGDQYLKNLMVVVTHGDAFQADMEHEDRENITFQEWCCTQKGHFKNLYDEFSDRFLLINNREKDPQKMDAQRREIIQIAVNVQTLNGRYTSKCFEEAKALRDRLIVEANLPMLNETIQKKVGLLVTDLLTLQKTPSHSQRESIQQSVNDLKKEITEQDKGTGLLNHLQALAEKVEMSLHDVDELHRVAKKLEETTQEKSSWSWYGALHAGLTVVSAVGVGGAVVGLFAATAPVGVGVAIAGGLVSKAGYRIFQTEAAKSITERTNLSKMEKQIKAEKDVLDSKVENIKKISEKSTNSATHK